MSYFHLPRQSVGLLAIIDLLQAEETFSSYVEYLSLRERGRRKDALVSLDAFVEEVASLPFERRRDLVHRLMTVTHRAHRDVSFLMPEQLDRGVVKPTLDEWAAREPQNPVPFRWRRRDNDDLRHAVRLDPNERIAREELAASLLAWVAFSVNKLPHGCAYAGRVHEDLEYLNEVDVLAAGLGEEVGRALKSDAAALRALIDAYNAFKPTENAATFRDWLWSEGRPLIDHWWGTDS